MIDVSLLLYDPTFVLLYFRVSCFDILMSRFWAGPCCRLRDSGFEEFLKFIFSLFAAVSITLRAFWYFAAHIISRDRRYFLWSTVESPSFSYAFPHQEKPRKAYVRSDQTIGRYNTVTILVFNRRDNLPCSPLPLPFISEASLPARNTGTTSTNPNRKATSSRAERQHRVLFLFSPVVHLHPVILLSPWSDNRWRYGPLLFSKRAYRYHAPQISQPQDRTLFMHQCITTHNYPDYYVPKLGSGFEFTKDMQFPKRASGP